MKHFKIPFRAFLTGLFFTCAGSLFAQSDVQRKILPTSTDRDIEIMISDLEQQGMTLKIDRMKRRRGGKIKKLSLQVESSKGKVTYRTSGFSGVIIERNANCAIGVRTIRA